MNNLEKMKQDIISQIRKMDVEEFEKLMNILVEYEEANKIILDVSNLFTCDCCRKKYGKCLSETDECSVRFEKYAMSNE